MADKLHFSLVTPEREVFAGPVDQVVAPGGEGDFGVLPNHAPLMSTLRPGWITVHSDGKTERVVVRGGFAEVTPAGLTVLAEEAVPASQIDLADVERRIAAVQEDMREHGAGPAQEAARDTLDYLLILREASAAATTH